MTKKVVIPLQRRSKTCFFIFKNCSFTIVYYSFATLNFFLKNMSMPISLGKKMPYRNMPSWRAPPPPSCMYARMIYEHHHRWSPALDMYTRFTAVLPQLLNFIRTHTHAHTHPHTQYIHTHTRNTGLCPRITQLVKTGQGWQHPDYTTTECYI